MKKSESSQRGGRTKKKKSRIVSYSLGNLPELNIEEIEHLSTLRDEDIDYSDIPPLTDWFWKNAVLVMPAPKKSISIRLDAEVYDWFKKQGAGYQSRINAVLKSYVNAQEKRK